MQDTHDENSRSNNFGDSWKSGNNKSHGDSRTLEDSFLRHDSVLDSLDIRDEHDSSSGAGLRDEQQSIILLKRQLEQIQRIRSDSTKKDQKLFEAKNVIRELRSHCKLLQAKIDLQESELNRSQRYLQNEQRGAVERQELAVELSVAQERNIAQQQRILELEFQLGVALKEAQIASDSALAKDKELVQASARHADEVQKVRQRLLEHESSYKELHEPHVLTSAQVQAVERTNKTLMAELEQLKEEKSTLLIENTRKFGTIEKHEKTIDQLSCELEAHQKCERVITENKNVIEQRNSEIEFLQTKLEQEIEGRKLAHEELQVVKSNVVRHQKEIEKLITDLTSSENALVHEQQRAAQAEESIAEAQRTVAEPLLKKLSQWGDVSKILHQQLSAMTKLSQNRFVLEEHCDVPDELTAQLDCYGEDDSSCNEEAKIVLLALESLRKCQIEATDRYAAKLHERESLQRQIETLQSDLNHVLGTVDAAQYKENALNEKIAQQEQFIHDMQQEMDTNRESIRELENEIINCKLVGEENLNELGKQLLQLFSNCEQLSCGCRIPGFHSQEQLNPVDQTVQDRERVYLGVASTPMVAKETMNASSERTNYVAQCSHALCLMWEEIHATHAKQHLEEKRVSDLVNQLEQYQGSVRDMERKFKDDAQVVVNRELEFVAASKRRLQESSQEQLAQVRNECESKLRAMEFKVDRAQLDAQHVQKKYSTALMICSLLFEGVASLSFRCKELCAQMKLMRKMIKTCSYVELGLNQLVGKLRDSYNISSDNLAQSFGSTRDPRAKSLITSSSGNHTPLVHQSHVTSKPIRMRVAVIAVIAFNRMWRILSCVKTANVDEQGSSIARIPFAHPNIGAGVELCAMFERLVSNKEFGTGTCFVDELNANKGNERERHRLFWTLLQQHGVANPFQSSEVHDKLLWQSHHAVPRHVPESPQLKFVQDLIDALAARLRELHQNGKSLARALRDKSEKAKLLEERLEETEDAMGCTNSIVEHLEDQLRSLQHEVSSRVSADEYHGLQTRYHAMEFTIKELQEQRRASESKLESMGELERSCQQLTEKTRHLENENLRLKEETRAKFREASLLKAYVKQKEEEAANARRRLQEANESQQTLQLSLREAQHNTNILLRSTAATAIAPSSSPHQ